MTIIKFKRAWLLHPWAIALLFFVMTWWVMPVSETLQFDPDEGIELAKVMLVQRGYRLYDQIWNDQPPLLTLFLSRWLNWFGASIVTARLFILGFASVLVGSFYGSLERSLAGSKRLALAGTLALCLTLNFLRLSVSVMRGLPALALAMLAVYWLLQADRRRLLGSGLIFGLSLQVKFYTVLIAPACLIHLLWGNPKQSWRDRIFNTGLWGFGAIATFLTVGVATQSLRFEQLIATHLNTTTQTALQGDPSILTILLFFAQDLDFVCLSLLGVWLLWKRRLSAPLLPLVWLLGVLLGFLNHRPLWYHYYPMLAVPIVWLATYGVTQALPWFRDRHWPRRIRPFAKPSLQGIAAGLVLFALVLTPIKLTVITVQNILFVRQSAPNQELVQRVRSTAGHSQWLFTDLPILAFYTGIPVPPEMAVFSSKRLKSGSLSPERLAQLLQRYAPEQVVLGRYPKLERDLQPALQQHYRPIFTKNSITQYQRQP